MQNCGLHLDSSVLLLVTFLNKSELRYFKLIYSKKNFMKIQFAVLQSNYF